MFLGQKHKRVIKLITVIRDQTLGAAPPKAARVSLVSLPDHAVQIQVFGVAQHWGGLRFPGYPGNLLLHEFHPGRGWLWQTDKPGNRWR